MFAITTDGAQGFIRPKPGLTGGVGVLLARGSRLGYLTVCTQKVNCNADILCNHDRLAVDNLFKCPIHLIGNCRNRLQIGDSAQTFTLSWAELWNRLPTS